MNHPPVCHCGDNLHTVMHCHKNSQKVREVSDFGCPPGKAVMASGDTFVCPYCGHKVTLSFGEFFIGTPVLHPGIITAVKEGKELDAAVAIISANTASQVEDETNEP